MFTALAELDTDAEWFPGIIARISEGEFISTIALELKVNYSVLRNWIRGSRIHEQAFEEAEKEGKKYRHQEAMKRVYEAATANKLPEPTRMEQLRAAEIIFRQQEQDRPAPQRFGDISITFVAAENGKPKEVTGEVIDQLP